MLAAYVYLDEDDQYEGRPLYEYLLRYLMHHNVRGATLFKGDMGFGSQHHLHAPGRLGALDQRPMMITFIDADERVRAVAKEISTIVTEGLIVLSAVERVG